MRAAVLTSTSLRHRYFLQQIKRKFDVRISLHEPKRSMAYKDASEESEAVRVHFEKLAESEQSEFKSRIDPANGNQIEVVDDINNSALIDRARQQNIDVIFLFGTAVLGYEWLDAFHGRIINLHLGLSPFYRGTATLFWPIANGEIECVGATIHLATERVDAGGILRRIKAELRVGDDYYTLTTRLIRRAIDAVPQTASDYLSARILPIDQAFEASKTYRRLDFNAAALTRALSLIGSGLTTDQIAAANASSKCVCSQ
jgi:phosphoribosylglycinamide formyltransferase 1